jgi:hypothetical protein
METTFQKSESIVNLTKALMLFSIKIGKIKKENTNPFFHSLYADLPAIQDAIADPLQESGLVVTQLPCGDGLITMLAHAESGEYIMANSIMKPVKNDPQSMGSAITYQRRYSLAALLNLNIDKDDDGNAASVAPQVQVNEKPWLNKFADKNKGILSKEWNGAIVKLQDGTTTIAKIKDYYRVSKENEQELLNIR